MTFFWDTSPVPAIPLEDVEQPYSAPTLDFGYPWFLLFCAVLIVVYQSVPHKTPRRVLLTLANLLFLVSYVPNVRSAVWLSLFVVLSYGAVRLIRARPSGWLLFGCLAFAVLGFLILKQYTFVTVLPLLPVSTWVYLRPVQMIGLSYMLFKFIHVLVDQREEQLAPLDFYGYASYQLSFFTLLAGPIQRYNDFYRFWNEMDGDPPDERDSLLCWNRVLIGMIKMSFLAPLIRQFFDQAGVALANAEGTARIWWFLDFFYSYPVFLYLNFSGYTDIAIGFAQLLGCRLPENFDRPYFARNIIDFWNRWHISLTHWIRDYVFMTSYKAVAMSAPRTAKYVGYGLLFMAMFLAGIWHGSVGYSFAVYGVLHGIGAAVAQAYGDMLRSILGRAGFVRYEKNQWVRGIATLVTLHFVCFTLLIFSSGVRRPLELLRAFGDELLNQGRASSPTQVGLYVLVLVLAIACFPVLLGRFEATFDFFMSRWKRLTRAIPALYAVVLVQVVGVTLLLWYAWALELNDAAVVYMRF